MRRSVWTPIKLCTVYAYSIRGGVGALTMLCTVMSVAACQRPMRLYSSHRKGSPSAHADAHNSCTHMRIHACAQTRAGEYVTSAQKHAQSMVSKVAGNMNGR